MIATQVRLRVPMWVIMLVLLYVVVLLVTPPIVLALHWLDQRNAVFDMLEEQEQILQQYGPKAFQGADIFGPHGAVNTTVAGSTQALLAEFSNEIEMLLDNKPAYDHGVERHYV